MTLYRVQAPSAVLPCIKKDLPVKRVLISGVGKIDFNPDSRQYVYFSRTDKHHVYYVFNKVFKIVAEEINRFDKASAILPGHDKMSVNDFYNAVNKSVLRDIREFLKDYVPSSSVELVSLSYLSSFYNFFVDCATSNKQKQTDHIPELSDTHFYGGAFGVNDAWLDLLKHCTTETSSSIIYLQDFFDYILQTQQNFSSARKTIRAYLMYNPSFMEILENIRWRTQVNPDFYDKNNKNQIRSALTTIFDEGQYNPDKHLSRRDFLRVKQDIISEMEQIR